MHPTKEEVDALIAFAKKHGRCWKAELRYLWANDRHTATPHPLRSLRNRLGTVWLKTYRLEIR